MYYNDLWRFRLNNNTWTLLSGSDTEQQNSFHGLVGIPFQGNVPGARAGPTGWYDAAYGDLWLYGGYGGTPDGACTLLSSN